jgi:hypothetical protein
MIILVFLFYEPVRTCIRRTVNAHENKWEMDKYRIGYFLKSTALKDYQLNNSYLVHDGYYVHLSFYLHVLQHRGINILLKDWQSLAPGDKIIIHQDKIKNEINKKYHYETEFIEDNISVLKLTGLK